LFVDLPIKPTEVTEQQQTKQDKTSCFVSRTTWRTACSEELRNHRLADLQMIVDL
jgi:hypothetical protein